MHRYVLVAAMTLVTSNALGQSPGAKTALSGPYVIHADKDTRMYSATIGGMTYRGRRVSGSMEPSSFTGIGPAEAAAARADAQAASTDRNWRYNNLVDQDGTPGHAIIVERPVVVVDRYVAPAYVPSWSYYAPARPAYSWPGGYLVYPY